MTIGDVVMKEFVRENGVQRVQRLDGIYAVLKSKNVPHVDELHKSEPNNIPPRVFLKPVGDERLPASGFEAYNAVVCVLQALEVRHGYHCFYFLMLS